LIENSFTISFRKDFWSSGESRFEANLVFLAAEATIHRFACRLDQVGVHLFIFQLHGFTFIFIALFILKHEALSRPNWNQIGLFFKN
jgi:hypothetical protein